VAGRGRNLGPERSAARPWRRPRHRRGRPAATLRGDAPLRALPRHRARTRLRQHRGPAARRWRSRRRHPRGRGRPLLVLNRMNTMTSTLAALLAVALLGCSQAPAPEAVAPEASDTAAVAADAPAPAEAALPLVVVH